MMDSKELAELVVTAVNHYQFCPLVNPRYNDDEEPSGPRRPYWGKPPKVV